MATQDDVRRIALALPGVVEETSHFAFSVAKAPKAKQFVWSWKERVHPKKTRVPNPKVIAVRVANELEKQALLSTDERKFFTEPHYDGYPAVLVNLDEVTPAELEPLIREAWRCRAPKDGGTPKIAKTTGRAKVKSAARSPKSKTRTRRATIRKGARKRPP